MSGTTLELALEPERFGMVAAGLQYVIGRPDTPEWQGSLADRHFDDVLCTCGTMSARLHCVRTFYDAHTKQDKWRIELGTVVTTNGWPDN